MLTLHTDAILTTLSRATRAALAAAGETATALTREQMLTGYAQPVYSTGTLYDSIEAETDGDTLIVGTNAPYAGLVHDGTRTTPGRPFLTDGVMGNADQIVDALSQPIKEAFAK